MKVTVGLEHEPGEEMQLDWLELSETPWGEQAYVLVGALSHSGRVRGVFSDGQTFAHLVDALDGVLRRLGGTADVVADRSDGDGRVPGHATGCGRRPRRPRSTTASRSRSARANRPQRKGVVEKAIEYVTQSWWRAAPVSTPAAGAGRSGPLVRRGL